MDPDRIRSIVARAKARGLISQAPERVPTPLPESRMSFEEPVEELPEPGDKERNRRLKKHVKTGLDMDFEVLAAFMSLEINAEVSPLRLNTILTKRISEMKSDGSFRKVPKVVLEMLESLRVPNFAPVREPEYTVSSRGGLLVVSGDGVESTLRSKSIQGLLRHCEWQINGNDLILSGGFVDAFGQEAVKRIWQNCQAASLC